MVKVLFILLLLLPMGLLVQADQPVVQGSDIHITDVNTFISKWNTSLGDGVSSITLPLELGGDYDFTVYWGDGNDDAITLWDDATHDYASGGVYDITIDGTLDGWSFGYSAGDKQKLIEISQWGSFGFGDSGINFHGASNLVLTATDAPDLTGTTTLYALISMNRAMESFPVAYARASFWCFIKVFILRVLPLISCCKDIRD